MAEQNKYKFQVFVPTPQGITVILETTSKTLSADNIKMLAVEQMANEKNEEEKKLYNECLKILYSHLQGITKNSITKDEHGYCIGNTPYGKIYVDKWAI